MLNTETNLKGAELTILLSGRLDTNTAPQLESVLKDSLNAIDRLVLDMKELEYISSAGLRVVLSAQKTMNRQGEMIIKNVANEVQEIFDVTGFSDILTIE